MTYYEPERNNQICRVDLKMRKKKRQRHEKMRTKRVLKCLWDFCLKYAAKIMQRLPRHELQGKTGYKEVTKKTADISEYCDFNFYDLAWSYARVHPSISEENRELGR